MCVNISVDDPQRDNRITRDVFMRKLCELDRSARERGIDAQFRIEDIWGSFGEGNDLSAFDRDTYSRSVLDELRIEGSIIRNPDGRIELTEEGRRQYCNPR